MKHSFLLALTALPILVSCAAKTPAPIAGAGAVAASPPAAQTIAMSGGLRVTPIETTPLEKAANGQSVWKFKTETLPENRYVICEVDLVRNGRVVQRISRSQTFVPMPGTQFPTESAMLVAVDWERAEDDAPAKMKVTVSRQDGDSSVGAILTVNDPFVGGLGAHAWNSMAAPQKNGNFLLLSANSSQVGTNIVDTTENELNLVCRFRLKNAPDGKAAPIPAPIPFALVSDQIEFVRPSADLMRQGFAYEAKVAIGYRGPRPDWWGRDAGVNWSYDQGLALADAKGKMRRVPTSNGTPTTGGSEPYYNSDSDKYVNTAIIAYSEMKGREGKLFFVQEMLAIRKPGGAIYQTVSAEQFARRRKNALAKVKMLAAVPPL